MLSSTSSKSIPVSHTNTGARTWLGNPNGITYTGMNISNGDLYAVNMTRTSLYRLTALSASVATLTSVYAITRFQESLTYSFSVAPNGMCIYGGASKAVVAVGGAYGSTETTIFTYTGSGLCTCLNPAGTTLYFTTNDWVIRRLNYSGSSWSEGTPVADLYALGIYDHKPSALGTDSTGNVYCICIDQSFVGLTPLILAIVSPGGTLTATYTSTVATADAQTKINMALDGNIIWFSLETSVPYTTKLYKWVIGGPDSLILGSNSGSVHVHPASRTVYVAIPTTLTLLDPNY